MTDETGRTPAYARAEQLLARPMLVLSLLLLPVLLLPAVWPGMPRAYRETLTVADWIIWAAFAVEYLLLLVLAQRRWLFVRTHLLQLVLVAVPVLRPLRVLRLARVARMARAGRAVAAGGHAVRLSRQRLATTSTLAAPVAALVLALSAAAVVTDAERGVDGANITGFGDGVWWAMTTLTTTGYGDRFPVTVIGRAVAVALMIVGFALLGVVTAGIASAFVRWSQSASEDEQRAESTEQHADIETVLAEVRALRAELAELRGPRPAWRQDD